MVSIDVYTQNLRELIFMKSISADSFCLPEIKRTANWIADQFKQHKFEVKLIEGYGNPIVFAKYTVDPALKTCLLYGHYDVQPAKIDEGWNTEPFVMTEKNGRLFGRGAIDDKGQLLVHMLSLFNLVESKQLG